MPESSKEKENINLSSMGKGIRIAYSATHWLYMSHNDTQILVIIKGVTSGIA